MRAVAIDRAAGSRRRMVVGSAILAAGVGSLVAGLSGGTIALVGLGAAVTFVAVAVLAPVLARPVARVIGAPMAQSRWCQRNAGPRERHAHAEADGLAPLPR